MNSLSDHQKNQIALEHFKGINQTDLARKYKVSRRTIYRALDEKRFLIPKSKELTPLEKKHLEVLSQYRITPAYLKELLERDQDKRICLD